MADSFFFATYFYNNNITLVLVFVTTFIIAYYSTRRAPNVPPGPPLWPIFGNMFSVVGKNLFRKLAILRQKYGDVFSLYIGSELWIFLNGYDVIHDALVKKGRLFSMRPISNFSEQFGGDLSPLVLENGIKWKERRSFLHFAFREICFADNGKCIEKIVQNETEHFIKDLVKRSSIIDPKVLISHSFTNIMLTIIHGRRFGKENVDFFVEKVENDLKLYTRGQILSNLFPFMQWFPWKLFGVIDDSGNKRNFALHMRMANEALKDYEEGQEMCIVHYYMKVLKTGKINGKHVTHGSFDMDVLKLFIHDLMIAGSETSATVTKWIFLYLMMDIDLQKKLHKEIDECIPKERLPSLSDRSRLPHVEATILEGLRIGLIIPLSVPRTVKEDTIFHGYLIAKNTTVIANLTSVLMDPEIFPQPESFKPERFLDETGKQVRIPKEMVPFSLGPRSCPGESFARLEIFLFVTTILQRFELKLPTGMEVPNTEGVFSLTYKPHPYSIEFHPRN